jgi:2,3-bisphosphoglycerate-independent phosphoglycerate mutase
MKRQKVFMLIWDGWGIAEDPAVSAIDAAHTPFYDRVRQSYPFTTLKASEEAVGLPEGQMGNSEVGHLHIGAGFVVWQDLPRIQRALETGELYNKPAYQALRTYLRNTGRPLHLLGLVSDGGIHSHLNHLLGLLRYFHDLPNPVYLHAFTDGRDTSPTAALSFLRAAETALTTLPNARLSSIIGRYYAMDRDRRWERTRLAYRLLVYGEGTPYPSAEAAIQDQYQAGLTDEFLKPAIIGTPAPIQSGDAVLFFNFRNDRPRQLVQALFAGDIPEGNSGRPAVPMPDDLSPLPLFFVTLTEYDPVFTERGVHYLFGKVHIEKPLGAAIAEAGLRQIRIAETYAVRDAILPHLLASEADFICLNFANPDMVGHTGVWEAAVKACETVDACSATLVEAALRSGYITLIIADHGNADRMKNPDGSPHTAHTLARVPCILISPAPLPHQLEAGILPQVAPTVLALMGLEVPPAMLPPLVKPL